MRAVTLLFVVLAVFAILMAPARAQEDLEEIEEIDTEQIDVDQAAQGEPQMSPEEMEARQKAYNEMIDYVMNNIPEACKAELTEALNTPPEQQRPDMLSEECRGPVNGAASEFQKARAGQAPAGEAPEAPKPVEPEPTPLKTVVTVVVGTTLPIAALIAYAYVKDAQRKAFEAGLSDEERRKIREAKERKAKADEKKAIKARRQGRPVDTAE